MATAQERNTISRTDYLSQSKRPLTTLVFLTPLVVAYEIGSALYLAGDQPGAGETIRAHLILSQFFGLFGVTGYYLPGLALVVALLVWHIAARQPWRVRFGVLAGMALESALWTAPIVVLGQLFSQGAAAALLAETQELASRPLVNRLTIAVGAGLYEELLFRLAGIAFIHFLLVDLLRAKELPARLTAIAATAAAFALYHDATLEGGVDAAALGFYFSAGVYFGALFVWRGFGIVVAAHALYDVVALTALGA